MTCGRCRTARLLERSRRHSTTADRSTGCPCAIALDGVADVAEPRRERAGDRDGDGERVDAGRRDDAVLRRVMSQQRVKPVEGWKFRRIEVF